MRILAAILICLLATVPLPVLAEDPSHVFSEILGEIGRQIERQQRQKQFKRLQPLWDACARSDVAACDRAARFPGLNAQGRADIERMRQAAEHHQAFVQNFHAYQSMDRATCQAALAYPPLSDTDRVRLQDWKRVADQRQDALADFHRNQRACYAGAIAACTAAIDAHGLDEGAVPDLERQRARLLTADRERQAAEQQRQAVLVEFHQNERRCYAGSIAACKAAITSSQVGINKRGQLESQRDRLQLADKQRQAAEQQREAAIREYERLRTDCAAGTRAACALAATHAQLRTSDIAFLKQQDRELAPISERLANVFTAANIANVSDGGSNNLLGPALLGLLAIVGAGFATVYILRNRAPALPAEREPPALGPQMSANQPSEPTTAASFRLTGHMPTDVRHALLGVNT